MNPLPKPRRVQKKRTLEERFERKVDRSAGPDGCHIWTGGVGQYGLPSMMLSKDPDTRKQVSIQGRRVAWQIAHGPVPEKRWVTSTCAEKRCVNPAHLVLRAHHDDAERFWENVAVGPGCWNWIGAFDKTTYGQFKVMLLRKPMRATRFVWELLHGPINDATMFVCHKCDNPKCVRPDHLFLGKALDNHRDMVAKGRASWQKKKVS